MKAAAKILTALSFVSLVYFAADTGLDRMERRECLDWRAAPQQEWASWQVDQCEHHELPLPQ